MNQNPSIHELQNNENFELVFELPHKKIKEFILTQIKSESKLVKMYMLYQFFMICLGAFSIGFSVIKFFDGLKQNLFYTLSAIIFCFSFLIVFHELIHGLSLKLAGASRVNYGANLKQFVFYAEADQFVVNRKQFANVALAPFVFIKLLCLIGAFIFISHPAVWFFVVVMSVHSLFCSGDVVLLSFFYHDSDELFSYDVSSEKKSYYFRRKKAN